MYTNSVLVMSGALVAAVAAVPMAEMHHHHHKRDYVWITKTEEAVVTVPVTKTVWIEPGETPPTGYSAPDVSPAGYSKEHTHSSSAPAYSAPAYTPESSPAESTSSSVYVAPIPSTSSVYVAPTPSSTYVAPTTSTSVYVAPTTYAAPTTSSVAAPAYTSASSDTGSGSGLSSGMASSGTSYTGDLTWYEVGLGACGITNTPDDHVVAISHTIFDSYNTGNPNENPLCGKHVTITGANGSPYTAKIVDRCPGCAEADLDLSQGFFNNVTNNADGRISGMKWICD